jgi:hypothetical protein
MASGDRDLDPAGTHADRRECLDLSLGGASDLTVVLTSATGEISGTVSDEKGPAAGVRIALVGGSNRLFATSDAAGAYRLTDIRPGTYKLAATDSHDPVTDEADLEAYEDAVVTVEVRPGDTRTQDLKRRTRP